MSGSLTDAAARLLRLSRDDRRLLLISTLGGGFGAVFGCRWRVRLFALEVQSIGRVLYEAVAPALTASIIGDLVVGGLGYHHHARAQLDATLTLMLMGKVAVAGLAFGLVGAVFAELTHAIKATMAARAVDAVASGARWCRGDRTGVAVRPRLPLGLLLPLIDRALAGDHLSFGVFALKIVFIAVTLGCAFPGGEFTPLFVIGSTLGAALAAPLRLPVPLVAALGFVAVFAGAANTPLACTIMGAELFGSGIVVPLAVTCVVAFGFSSHRGIYPTQRIHAAKGRARIDGRPTLSTWSRRDRR